MHTVFGGRVETTKRLRFHWWNYHRRWNVWKIYEVRLRVDSVCMQIVLMNAIKFIKQRIALRAYRIHFHHHLFHETGADAALIRKNIEFPIFLLWIFIFNSIYHSLNVITPLHVCSNMKNPTRLTFFISTLSLSSEQSEIENWKHNRAKKRIEFCLNFWFVLVIRISYQAATAYHHRHSFEMWNVIYLRPACAVRKAMMM